MPRLPQPGHDNGTWGDILNDFLSQTHKPDGTIKDDTVGTAQLRNNSITEAHLDTAVKTKLNATAGVPDWTTITNKPTVIAAGSDQAAARAAIGLASVNNTSDTNKPISAATQVALDGKETKNAAGFNARDFGVVWDGVADDTEAIQRALDGAYAAGGGDVLFPVGVGCFSDVITVPAGVNIIGKGTGKNAPDIAVQKGTWFKATTAHAQLLYGASAWPAARGGISGHFVVDGNDIATSPLCMRFVVQRTFQSIDVLRATSIGMLVEYGQNNLFQSINIEDVTSGVGLVVDNGAGGNLFERCEANNCLTALIIQQSKTDSETYDAYPAAVGPNHNNFIHCIFERPTHDAVRVVHVKAGGQNYLTSCMIATTDEPFDTPPLVMLDVEYVSGGSGCSLTVWGGQIQGSAAGVKGIRVSDGASLLVRGGLMLHTLDAGVVVAEGAYIDADEFQTNSVTTLWEGSYNTYARFRSNLAISQSLSETSDVAYEIAQAGDGYPRFRAMGDGSLYWFSGGSWTEDTVLDRPAAGVLRAQGFAAHMNSQAVTENGTVTIPPTNGLQLIYLQANVASSTIGDGVDGQEITIIWVQDSAGGRTYAWPTNCQFAGNAAPSPSSTPNARDSMTFYWDSGNWWQKTM